MQLICFFVLDVKIMEKLKNGGTTGVATGDGKVALTPDHFTDKKIMLTEALRLL